MGCTLKYFLTELEKECDDDYLLPDPELITVPAMKTEVYSDENEDDGSYWLKNVKTETEIILPDSEAGFHTDEEGLQDEIEIKTEIKVEDHEIDFGSCCEQVIQINNTLVPDNEVGDPESKCTEDSPSQDGKVLVDLREEIKHELDKCEICGEIFHIPHELTEHLEIHKKQKEYNSTFNGEETCVCHICGKLLVRGVETQSEELFECNECFSDPIHQRKTYQEENPYKCTECGKCFTRRSYLSTHARTHTGEKPYKCAVCGRGFGQRIHLTKHERIHSGEKPFDCNDCGKSFNRRGYLVKHMRTHTGEKPYTCDICSKKFSQRNHLTKHARIHCGETQ